MSRDAGNGNLSVACVNTYQKYFFKISFFIFMLPIPSYGAQTSIQTTSGLAYAGIGASVVLILAIVLFIFWKRKLETKYGKIDQSNIHEEKIQSSVELCINNNSAQNSTEIQQRKPKLTGQKLIQHLMDENNSLKKEIERKDEEARLIQARAEGLYFFGDNNKENLIHIRTTNSDLFQSAKKINAKAILSPMAQIIPTATSALRYAGKKIMEVDFPDNRTLAQALVPGGGFRGFFHDPVTGKIEGHAVLKNLNGSNLFTAAAVWQIASIVTAQKHLADINQKLTNIENKVNKLQKFFENQMSSEIQASIDYLKSIAEAYGQGLYPQEILTTMEHIHHRLWTIYTQVKSDIPSLLDEKIEDPNFFSNTAYYKNVDEWENNYRFKSETAFSALKALSISSCLMTISAADEKKLALASIRMNKIQKEIEELEMLELPKKLSQKLLDAAFVCADRDENKKIISLATDRSRSNEKEINELNNVIEQNKLLLETMENAPKIHLFAEVDENNNILETRAWIPESDIPQKHEVRLE